MEESIVIDPVRQIESAAGRGSDGIGEWMVILFVFTLIRFKTQTVQPATILCLADVLKWEDLSGDIFFFICAVVILLDFYFPQKDDEDDDDLEYKQLTDKDANAVFYMFKYGFTNKRIAEILRIEEFEADDFLLYTDSLENINIYLSMINQNRFEKNMNRNKHFMAIFVRQCRTTIQENPQIMEDFN